MTHHVKFQDVCLSSGCSSVFSPAYFDQICDLVPDGILVIDRQGKIIYANVAVESISGYSPRELIGQPCTIFRGDSCMLPGGDMSRCALFRGQKFHKRRCTIVHKDGHPVHILKNAVAVRNSDGQFTAAIESITDISEIVRRDQEIHTLRQKLSQPSGFMGMIGSSSPMQKVFDLIRSAALSDAPVIIYGESGTGKELVAAAIHKLSKRRRGPFIKVNCAALSRSLLESELFGHVKGAFTGANKDRIGRFEAAHKGTLFLDEIGDIPLGVQVKLLRVLESKEIERVGDYHPISVDVRFISATHRDLLARIEEGKFRDDLYYRLNIIPIYLPPLREREGDLVLLINYYVEKIAQRTQRPVPAISPPALKALLSYHWPGNVRELFGALEYAFVTCRSNYIEPEHLPMTIIGKKHKRQVRRRKMEDLIKSRDEILDALKRTGYNKTAAARLLGVSRVTLWKWLKKLPDLSVQESLQNSRG